MSEHLPKHFNLVDRTSEDLPEKKKSILPLNHDAERYVASASHKTIEESKGDFKSKVLARFRRMGE